MTLRTCPLQLAVLLFFFAACSDVTEPDVVPSATTQVFATGNLNPSDEFAVATDRLVGQDGSTIGVEFAFQKRVGLPTWDWCVDCDFVDGLMVPRGQVDVIVGGTGTVSFTEGGEFLSWIHSDGDAKIVILDDDTTASFSVSAAGADGIPELTCLATSGTTVQLVSR